MKSLHVFCLFVVVFLCSIDGSHAAGRIIQQGTWDISVTSSSDVSFQPSIGYFIGNNLELTAMFSFSEDKSTVGGENATEKNKGYGGSLVYLFKRSYRQLVPFIGIGYEKLKTEERGFIARSSFDDSLFAFPSRNSLTISIFHFETGGRYFLSDNSSVNFTYKLLNGGTERNLDFSSKEMSLGYSLYF